MTNGDYERTKIVKTLAWSCVGVFEPYCPYHVPSNFAAVTTSPRKGGDVGARHEALGSDAMRSGEGKSRKKGRSRDRLREAGRETGTQDREREKGEASEEVG